MASEEQVSQRRLAEWADLSVSVVNGYLAQFGEQGWVDKEPLNNRDLRYRLTSPGERQMAEMAVEYMRETFVTFSHAKKELARHLSGIQRRHDLRRVVLYPAGEVTELVIHALPETSLEVLAIVDDEPQRQNRQMFGLPVIARESITDLDVDGVIVTTFRYRDALMKKVSHLEDENIRIVSI